ncbi:MAG: AMP-binding protein [Alphaproteobacteria bacterium]|nr:AMP-binding protein [Alphaproteobacteria bacterium]
MKNFIRFVLRCVFRIIKIRISGCENVSKELNKGIYVSNHQSWLDPVVLFAFLPKDPVFLLHPKLYRNKWIQFFMRYAEKIEFNYMDAADVKKVISIINEGKFCLMFPEGCMTDTGDIMKVYEAPAVIADRTEAPLIPIWIAGAEYSPFSETEGYQPHRPFPKIKIRVGKPEYFKMNDDLRKNRDYLKDATYQLLNRMRFETKYKSNMTLFHTLLRVSRIYGKIGFFKRREVLEDINRQPQTYMDILVKSYVMGDKFAGLTQEKEYVGVLLPNTVATVVTVFGLSAYNRVPVMLNFSQGESVVSSMCKTAVVKTVLTSKAFILKAKMEGVISRLESDGIQIKYLEDIAKTITLKNKIKALVSYKLKKLPVKQSSDEPAVVLFTSGSEGFPKGVVLTHKNIVANVMQAMCFAQLTTQDILFNSLPMFHSFGFVVGVFFPLFLGAKSFLFPSPLLYRTITELLYELKVTVMVATNTFYKVYTKISHPYDFKTIRLCYAGAEAVQEETRQAMAEKLGCLLMEAYGTTECSPILCINNILFNKFGTLGKLVQSIEHKIEPVPGIEIGGELCVKGPNVMKGYILADNPGVIVPVPDGWYHTGDVVVIDELGFVKIVDRIKRFAKIAGEMISLTAVENLAREIWPDDEFHGAAVTLPHPKKGEYIVFVSNSKEANKDAFVAKVQEKGMSELYIPSEFMYKEEFPIFATGKADLVTLKKWVQEQVQ